MKHFHTASTNDLWVAGLLLVVLFSVSSCKRNYTCICDGAYISPDRKTTEFTKVTKKQAKKDCQSLEDANNQFAGANTSCHLN